MSVQDTAPAPVQAVDKGQTYQSVWAHMMQVPFKQDYVEAGGLRTRYVEAGDPNNPPLLMLHGTGGHWETFIANLGALSQHYHCFAVDMLGCGFTDKPDRPYEIPTYGSHVLAFMDKMGVVRPSIVGVSLGAWVAVGLALTHPERVDKLILMSPPGLYPDVPGGGGIASRNTAAANPSWDNVRAVLARLIYDESRLADDFVAIRQRIYSDPNIGKIMPRMLTLFDAETRKRNTFSEEQWRSIKAPTLIFAHVDAPDIYLDTAFAIAKLLPDNTLVEIHKTAHWSHFENPEVFNKAALEFLASK